MKCEFGRGLGRNPPREGLGESSLVRSAKVGGELSGRSRLWHPEAWRGGGRGEMNGGLGKKNGCRGEGKGAPSL